MIKNVGAIVADFSSLGVVSVDGKSASKFLQGQITQDISQVSEDCGALGSYLTPKGRVISTFIILQIKPESYYLLMPKSIIDIFIEKMSKYAIFSKIIIQDVSEKYQVIAQWTSEQYTTWSVKPAKNKIITVANTHMLLHLIDNTGYQSYKENMRQTHTLVSEDIVQLTLIQARIPLIHPENTEIFTIHDLGLDKLNAVNFKKGCYTGQEIVARMHYKAKLKHHLYLVKFEQILADNQIFIDNNDNEVGRVVHGSSNDNGYLALVWLRDEKTHAEYLVTPEKQVYHFTVID